jgi:hypothetical protein
VPAGTIYAQPIITNLTTNSGVLGSAGFTGTMTISNGTAPYILKSQSGIPTGLTAVLTGTSIHFTGTPTASGIFNGSVTIEDSVGTSAIKTFTITINSAPTITGNPASVTYVRPGQNTSLTASANNGFPAATTVKWQVSTDGGNTWTDLANTGFYSGVTTTTLTVAAADMSLNGFRYRAVFSNASGLTATTTAGTLTVKAYSQYAYAAYQNAYYAWYYAYYAYATSPSGYSWAAYNYANSALYYARLAYQYDQSGDVANSATCAYYAYYYGYQSSVYSWYVYATTGNAWAYAAYYYGYYSYVYSYQTAIGN